MKINHSFGGLLSSLEKTQCKFVSKQAQDIMANSNKTLLHSNILQAGIRPLLQKNIVLCK